MDNDYEDYYPGYRQANSYNLLQSGWKPLYRHFDAEYFWQLAMQDPWALAEKFLDVCSDVANAVGRREYSPLANFLNLFSENTRYEIEEFWNSITPPLPGPDYTVFQDQLSTETPIRQQVSRDQIPIDYVLRRLQEMTVLRVLAHLGRPAQIVQFYMERYFYYPVERFSSWEEISSPGTTYAFWPEHQIWLQVQTAYHNRRRYTLLGVDLRPLIRKVTYNLAVMVSGYQSRIGQVYSPYPISSFPAEIQAFTDQVQQQILQQERLAVLVHGIPGTGKTAWTQAVAHELLVPLGYVVFILDHEAVQEFIAPPYLERVCLIINEADNLAQDRASEVAQQSTKTERILSLLDGTLHQSVLDPDYLDCRQRLVVLMTCNTTERLDPAVLRKGRVDLIQEFTHRFV
ncbi:ATP-binding protein [Synechococcus sp. H55.7]|uniref:AAA family ATPase n=2 Tax=Synechococcus TaxID=1129 RepID=UPI0039C12367